MALNEENWNHMKGILGSHTDNSTCVKNIHNRHGGENHLPQPAEPDKVVTPFGTVISRKKREGFPYKR